jgi:hypothetical protein
MSTTLPAVRDNGQATTPARTETPLRIDDLQVIAAQVARSRLWGLDESQAFALMLLAHSKGLHPVQAVERYHVVNGKPVMKADAILAEFQASGGIVTWHRHDETECSATFTCNGISQPVTITWTIEDAKRADLLRNPTWSKYPRQMLKARVISEGIKMAMPGVSIGIYTPEEAMDFDPLPPRIEPERPAPAPAKPGRKRDERTCTEVIIAGVEAAEREFHAEFPDAAPDAWTLTPYQVERHCLKVVTGKSTEGKANDYVRAQLFDLYEGPKRSAIRKEIAAYVAAQLSDARKAQLQNDVASVFDRDDDADPDVDMGDVIHEGREPGQD